MPSRRTLLTVIVLGLLTAAPANAQEAKTVWRVGHLSGGGRTPDGLPPQALRQALRKLGYIEGVNVAYESRFAEGKSERHSTLAAELIRLKVDVIVVSNGPAAMATKSATSTIPIIVAPASGDAVALGLMASLAHPGGNVTGLSDESVQLSAKRMGLLKEMLPNAKRIAVVWNANDEGMTLRYREIERAARVLNLEVRPLEVRQPIDFDTAISAMARQRPDAIFLVADTLTSMNRKAIIEFATAQRIPSMYETNTFVRDGGLMSYGYSMEESWGEAALYIDRIFKGMKPADLPATQPMRYYLTINRKSADALGVTIPQSVLIRSDEVVQ
jgi:putative ABC transport system substrate-binding protein